MAVKEDNPYFLKEEQLEIIELVRDIAENEVKPIRAELDEKNEFPTEIMKKLAKADLTGLYIDQAYGGFNDPEDPQGVMNLCLATEELSKVCGGVAVSFAANALGAFPIILSGSEEQKKEYLPRIASGTIAAFGLTEPEAGSDASAVKTTAVKDGDHYILNGTKQWITNGGEADIYTIFCNTDKTKGARGMSCIIVEKGTPGFEFGKKEDKLGIRSSATRELIFTDCKVPAKNILRGEGYGFLIGMQTFANSRPGIAAQAVGIATGALDEAIDYAHTREQFGQKIGSFQGIQFMLADMAIQIEASRALTYSAARMVDAGFKMQKVEKYAAMAKTMASDTAMKVTVDALQILGGYGYMKEYPAEKYMRDAKITQIYEGTNQIQRLIINNILVRELAAKKRKK